MARFTGIVLTLSIASLFSDASHVQAQGGGMAGGAFGTGNFVRSSAPGFEGTSWHPMGQLLLLPPESALNFITIDGTADVRVVPEGIRVVLAVTTARKTADECQQTNAAQVQAVLKAWSDLKIHEDDIVADFINILPIYEWRLTNRDGQEFFVEKQEGYRMQTNLHVSVKTEMNAMAAINIAFKQAATEIVTFDYWSSALNEQKVKVRALAMQAATEKAKTLLAVFAEQPKVINIQESTAVFVPRSLYQTYENVLKEEVENHNWHNQPSIRAPRPVRTFFQGLQGQSDISPSTPAMSPEIAVVSSVRLYYQSPADKTVSDKKK